MFQAELRVTSGRQTGSTISLPRGKFLIGREEDCHLRPNSELVSRHHCVFTTDETSVRLRDLGSTNGTFLNGEQVRGTMTLNHGDHVAVGKLEFEVCLRDPTMEDTSMDLAQETQTALPTGNVVVDEQEAVGEEPSTSATMMEMPVAAGFPGAPDTGMGQPMMPPGMYGQPLGFPPGYPQYGYPGYPMPGYYPQMGYPQPMPGYPGMQPMPPMGMPQQPQQAPAPAAAPSSEIEVKLPDPETTGAKAPEPPKPAGEGKSGDKPATIPETAADIIKQYRTRRPSS